MSRPRKIVLIDRKQVPVEGEQRINGRQYFLLKELVTGVNGSKYHAFDPHAGLHGEERRLIVLPRNDASELHLKSLHRIRRQSHLFAQILDIQKTRTDIHIVLDWVSGPTMKDYLDQVRAGNIVRPSLREAFRLARTMAHDLSRLHRHAFIVHGDLHPENLILHRDSSRLVLIDFGSAWLMEAARGRHQTEGHRALYAAPEIFDTEIAPHESADRFVAAMIAYELLTLQVPYEGLGGKAGWSQYRNEMTGTLSPPCSQHPDRNRVPLEAVNSIDAVISRGLDLQQGQRFQTGREWTDAYDKAWCDLNSNVRSSAINERVSAWMAAVVNWFR